MKKIKEWLLPIYLILNTIWVMVGSELFATKIIKVKKFSQTLSCLMIINLIIIIIMFIYKRIKKKEIRFKITDFFIILITIFGIISVIFAIKPKYAFFGFSGRYEGFLQISYYFTLVILGSLLNKKHKKVVMYAIVFCGTIEAIDSFLQISQLAPVHTQYHNGKPWATGFITNPNFFGTFMLLTVCYSIGLILDNKKIIAKIIFSFTLLASFVGLFLSNTLSVIVGLAAASFIVLIYVIKNRKFGSLILIVLIALTSMVIVNSLNSTSLIKDIKKTAGQAAEMAKGNFDDSFGSKRIFIWKRTLRALPKHILTGAGIDNFYYAFGKKPLTIGKWFFDKAHNEYLQILICEGIFALASYLLLFGTVTLRGLKSAFKNKELYIILPIIGHLVQAFFNISVIEVAPFFYLALGLAIERTDNKCKYDNSIYTRLTCFYKNKKLLNLSNPKTFSDKIVYLNIFDKKNITNKNSIIENKDYLNYKLYCIDGKVECILFRNNKNKYKIYNTKWKEQDYIKNRYKLNDNIAKPDYLNKLIKYAESLSKDTKFVRIDLLYINDQIELNTTNYVPIESFYNKQFENDLGSKLQFNRIGIIECSKDDDNKDIKDNYLNNNSIVNINNLYKKNIFIKLIKIFNIVKYNDDVILLSNKENTTLLFNKIYKRNIYDYILDDRYNKDKFKNKTSKKITTIYVKSKKIKDELNKKGLTNVEVISKK